MLKLSDVQDLLAAWGQWVVAEGNGLGYSSPMAAIMRGHVVEERRRPFAMFITDDEALKVERVITRLCNHKPLEGKVLMLKYVDRMSDRAIARQYLTPLKHGKDSDKWVGSHQTANYIAYAEGFILGSIMN